MPWENCKHKYEILQPDIEPVPQCSHTAYPCALPLMLVLSQMQANLRAIQTAQPAVDMLSRVHGIRKAGYDPVHARPRARLSSQAAGQVWQKLQAMHAHTAGLVKARHELSQGLPAAGVDLPDGLAAQVVHKLQADLLQSRQAVAQAVTAGQALEQAIAAQTSELAVSQQAGPEPAVAGDGMPGSVDVTTRRLQTKVQLVTAGIQKAQADQNAFEQELQSLRAKAAQQLASLRDLRTQCSAVEAEYAGLGLADIPRPIAHPMISAYERGDVVAWTAMATEQAPAEPESASSGDESDPVAALLGPRQPAVATTEPAPREPARAVAPAPGPGPIDSLHFLLE